jgi:hypothetical protein
MSFSNSSVFRKVALDRLSSPEQLDLLMQVTSPRSWLAFLALALLAATAVYWSIFGQISLQQSAPAVLITTGGIKNVVVVESGQIYAWHVEVGDVVTKNQTVAEIILPGQDTRVPLRTLFDGRILERQSELGQLVQSGDSLASLQLVGPEVHLEAILYLTPAEAAQVNVGMPVAIAPVSTAGSERLAGVVIAVGDFPVTQQHVARLLGNDTLMQSLLPSPSPIEIRVLVETDLAVDQLPPGLLGSLGSATIQIGTRRPIELVMPVQRGN